MAELYFFTAGFRSTAKTAYPLPAPTSSPLQDHGDSRKVSMTRALENVTTGEP